MHFLKCPVSLRETLNKCESSPRAGLILKLCNRLWHNFRGEPNRMLLDKLDSMESRIWYAHKTNRNWLEQ